MFTHDNTLDCKPEHLAQLNDELNQRLHGIDPNDYTARQKVEADFRAEVHHRPRPSGAPAEPIGACILEHDQAERDAKAAEDASDDAAKNERIAADDAENERIAAERREHERDEAANTGDLPKTAA